MSGRERGEVGGPKPAEAAAQTSRQRVVHEGYTDWNAGRLAEAMARLWHPDAILYHPAGWPEPGPSIGREAATAQFERVREDFDVDRLEILESRDIAGVVVLRVLWVVRGRASGVDASMEMSGVYWFDGADLIVRNAFFWDHDAALNAAVE